MNKVIDGLSKGLYTYSLTFNLSLFRSLISDQVSDCHWFISLLVCCSCPDPESYVRGGPTLTTFFFLVDEGREDPNTTSMRAIIDPPAKRHLNGVLLTGR